MKLAALVLALILNAYGQTLPILEAPSCNLDVFPYTGTVTFLDGRVLPVSGTENLAPIFQNWNCRFNHPTIKPPCRLRMSASTSFLVQPQQAWSVTFGQITQTTTVSVDPTGNVLRQMRVVQPSQDNRTILQFDLGSGAYRHTRDVLEPSTGNQYHYVGAGSIPISWQQVDPSQCAIEPLVLQPTSLPDYACTGPLPLPGPANVFSLLPTLELNPPLFYRGDLKVNGGIPPYTYEVVGGELPSFLQLSNGQIVNSGLSSSSCLPPNRGRKIQFALKVRDSLGTATPLTWFTVNANPPRYVSLADKPKYRGTAVGLTAAALVALVGSTVCTFPPGCAAAAQVAFEFLALPASHYIALALDPPDPNFSVMTQLQSYAIPATSLPLNVNGPFQNFLRNTSQASAYAGALLRSLERSMGAYDASDVNWFETQNSAAAGFTRGLVSYQQAQGRLASAWVNSWKAGGLPAIAISDQQVTQVQQQLVANGLPFGVELRLRNSGFSPAAINDLVTRLVAISPSTVTGVFPDKIASLIEQASSEAVPTLINYARSFPVVVVAGDVNGDRVVNCADLTLVRSSIGKQAGMPGFLVGADMNVDGIVDVRDLAFVSRSLPVGAQCP